MPFRSNGDEQGLTQLQSQLHDLPAELCDNIMHALHCSHLLDASSLHFLVHLHGLSVLDIRLLYLHLISGRGEKILISFNCRDVVSIRAEHLLATARQWRSLTTMKLTNCRFPLRFAFEENTLSLSSQQNCRQHKHSGCGVLVEVITESMCSNPCEPVPLVQHCSL